MTQFIPVTSASDFSDLISMPKYKVTCTELFTPSEEAMSVNPPTPGQLFPSREVYVQQLDSLDLPAFIRALNPVTRKRRKGAKEEKSGA